MQATQTTLGENRPKNFDEAEVISTYSRAQAIEDSVLIDVTEAAKRAGIKYPVAITRNLWSSWVEVPPELKGLQDASGRLWDVLWMFTVAARQTQGDRLTYHVLFQGSDRRMHKVKLYSVIGPGDQGEPVITIMLPGDD